MTDHHVRPLREDEQRTAHSLFRTTLHTTPADDGEWENLRAAFQPQRTLGVFDEPGTLVGTARSFDAKLTVPGGTTVPLAAVTGVGVRADRTRRGVLTDLMRAQFTEFTERGVVAAALYASEAGIYGRFGYGIGTLARNYTVNRQRAQLIPDAPAGGEVRLFGPHDVDDVITTLERAFPALSGRPGTMNRPSAWWAFYRTASRNRGGPTSVVVHDSGDTPDGFAVYTVERDAAGKAVLRVDDLHAASAEAFAGLWRFLLSVDLIDEIRARMRPVDEPVELLFEDPRACTATWSGDESWLRLVDVPAALSARSYVGEPLVVEVTDNRLPANSGRYRIGPDGVRRSDERSDLQLGVDALAMVYLGAWRPSQLVEAGRARVADPGVPDVADRLLFTGTQPWCGTFF